MTYKKFKSKIDSILGYKVDEELSVSWCVVGRTGGSCWETEHYDVTPESPKELEQLDTILGALCPNITFLMFRELTHLIEKGYENDGNDYYGNHYEHETRSITLQSLYDFLIEKELI